MVEASRGIDLLNELACRIDPVAFSVRSGIITPDPWQERVLRSNAKQLHIAAHRQAGKSEAVAIRAMHRAIYFPGSLILIISRGIRQAGELFRKCSNIYDGVERPVDSVRETVLQLELTNGSRIVSLPGTEATVRSFSSVDLLIIDEAARVPDDLFFTVRPMLAVSQGTLITMSTFFGTRGFFYDIWKRQWNLPVEERSWDMYSIPVTECKRISKEFLEEEWNAMGAWWYNQEYLNIPMDAQSSVFRSSDVTAMTDESIESWDGLGWTGGHDDVLWDLSAPAVSV